MKFHPSLKLVLDIFFYLGIFPSFFWFRRLLFFTLVDLPHRSYESSAASSLSLVAVRMTEVQMITDEVWTICQLHYNLFF